MTTAYAGTLLQHIQKLVVPHGVPPATDRQLLDDFRVHRDEAAFALLVARHGPMVLRVCHRVLGHEQDAEDAFQATFLVLARNTASIRQREALAGWLHGVAQRTALKAKRTAARRRRREGQSRSPVPASPPALMWEEVRTVLDEEVGRLAEPFRSAFVLCILEGKTGPEAAAVLDCKEATLYTRMNRARRFLQKALAARGIELATLLGALAIAEGAAEAAPATLIRATVGFGLLVAAGEPVAGVIPAHVAALAAGVTRAMFLSKAKIALAVLFTASLIAAGAGVLAQRVPVTNEPTPPPAAPSAKQSGVQGKPRADDAKRSVALEAEVLKATGPGGRFGPGLEVRPVGVGKEAAVATDGFRLTVARGDRRVTITLTAAEKKDARGRRVIPSGDGLGVARLAAGEVAIVRVPSVGSPVRPASPISRALRAAAAGEVTLVVEYEVSDLLGGRYGVVSGKLTAEASVRK